MIPKIIHYCWFGRGPLPELAQKCIASWKKYLPDYEIKEWNEDNFDVNIIPYTAEVLDESGGFICDAYYPTLAQFGIVGVFFFCWFWKRRLAAFDIIADMRYYRVAMITFCCLAIEQTADSSWLSGKGMGYCMLIALCLNANRNRRMQIQSNEKNKNSQRNFRRNKI